MQSNTLPLIALHCVHSTVCAHGLEVAQNRHSMAYNLSHAAQHVGQSSTQAIRHMIRQSSTLQTWLQCKWIKTDRQTDRQAASSPSPGCRASGRLSFLPCPSHQPTWFGPNVLALGNMPFCRCLIEPSAAVWAEYKARVGGRCNGGSSKGCDSSLQYSFVHSIMH